MKKGSMMHLLQRYTVLPGLSYENNAIRDNSLEVYSHQIFVSEPIFWTPRSKFDDLIRKIIAVVLLWFAVVLIFLSLIAGVFTGGSGTVLGFTVTWWVVLIAVALLVGCAAWADSEEVSKFFNGLRQGADEVAKTVIGLGGSIAKGAADTISDVLLSNPLFWIGGGLLAYYIFFTEDEQGSRKYVGPDIVIGSGASSISESLSPEKSLSTGKQIYTSPQFHEDGNQNDTKENPFESDTAKLRTEISSRDEQDKAMDLLSENNHQLFSTGDAYLSEKDAAFLDYARSVNQDIEDEMQRNRKE